jgi:WD40 repeat protein
MDRKLVSEIIKVSESCSNWPHSSKDTKIRVWNRETLELHRTLTGHEGPVNAIGLQNGFIVSASGDTKMMLWDIDRGTCLRTFDGHDRGLACIEFKVLFFLLRMSAHALTYSLLAVTGQLHRVRLERLHNQGVGRDDRRMPSHPCWTRLACACARP